MRLYPEGVKNVHEEVKVRNYEESSFYVVLLQLNEYKRFHSKRKGLCMSV